MRKAAVIAVLAGCGREVSDADIEQIAPWSIKLAEPPAVITLKGGVMPEVAALFKQFLYRDSAFIFGGLIVLLSLTYVFRGCIGPDWQNSFGKNLRLQVSLF
jgi:hypothetical protein